MRRHHPVIEQMNLLREFIVSLDSRSGICLFYNDIRQRRCLSDILNVFRNVHQGLKLWNMLVNDDGNISENRYEITEIAAQKLRIDQWRGKRIAAVDVL